MPNTEITYMYRDASNYKIYNTIIVKGELISEEIDLLIGCLEDGEFFIPADVGLPPLQKRWDFLNEDDHVQHELSRDDIRAVDELPTLDISVHDLMHRFLSVEWDVNKAEWDLWY